MLRGILTVIAASSGESIPTELNLAAASNTTSQPAADLITLMSPKLMLCTQDDAAMTAAPEGVAVAFNTMHIAAVQASPPQQGPSRCSSPLPTRNAVHHQLVAAAAHPSLHPKHLPTQYTTASSLARHIQPALLMNLHNGTVAAEAKSFQVLVTPAYQGLCTP